MTESKHIVIKHTAASSGLHGAAHPKVVHTRPAVPPVLRKQKSRGPAIAIGVVCGVVALGVGAVMLNVYKQHQREARQETLALLAQQAKAESLCGRLPSDVAKMEGFLDQADRLVAVVDEVVRFVAGSADDQGAAGAGHAELMQMAKGVAANRETMDVLLVRLLDWLPILDVKRAEALKAQRHVVAAAAVVAIESHLRSVDDLISEAGGVLQQMEAQAAGAGRLREAEIRSRAARAEAESRQREAQDLQRRTEKELRQSADLYALAKVSIRRYAFDEALAAMENALAGFTTAPGREALALPVERVRRLQALKTHLITCLNNSPYRWGWGMTAAENQDILGADETGVKIARGVVAWEAVPVPQLIKIIEYLGKTGRRRSSELAEDGIATAILLDELGLKAQACERVRAAIGINRLLSDDARRLLPDCQ